MNRSSIVSGLLLISFSAFCMEVIRDGTSFIVKDSDGNHMVQRYDLHQSLRNISADKLKKFEDLGNRYKISRLQTEHGYQYAISPAGGLNGGGGLLGAAVACLGTVATGVVSVGVLVGTTAVTLNPAAGFIAAGLTAKAGISLTVYATILATTTPTP